MQFQQNITHVEENGQKKESWHAAITGPMCFCCFNGFIQNTRESDKVWEVGRVNRDKTSTSMSMSFTFCACQHTHTHTHWDSQNLVLCILNIYEKLSAPLSLGLTDMRYRQTNRYMYVCMYKQLSSPLQACCRHSPLYVTPYRLCWFRPQLLENRMQIIIQHDPQTHMYAKLRPVLARVLSVNMNLLTYTKTTSLCFCWAPASWLLSSFHIIPNNYATVQYTFVCSHCRWNWYDSVFLLKHPLQSKPSSVHPTLRFGLFSTIKNCVCNAKTRVFRTVR